MMCSLDKKTAVAPTKIGDTEAQQPLSGVTSVDTTRAVNGNGQAAYVRACEDKSGCLH